MREVIGHNCIKVVWIGHRCIYSFSDDNNLFF